MKANKIKKLYWERREAFRLASRNFSQFMYWLNFDGAICAVINKVRAVQARIVFQNDGNYSFYSEIALKRYFREYNQDYSDSIETIREKIEASKASDFYEVLKITF